MTKILYVSTLCSENILDLIFRTANSKPEQAAQKFHRLLAQGFAQTNPNGSIDTYSALPITPANHSRKFWSLPKEKNIKGVNYHYVPTINIKYLKNIFIFFFTFLKTVYWNLKYISQKKYVVCDILNLTVSSAALLACKITFTPCVAIVTDLPGLMVTNIPINQSSFFSKIHKGVISLILYRFSKYILLTPQMNSVVNPKNKPFIIMEGLVDFEMDLSENKLEDKSKERNLIYAGGLYEKYGVKSLIDAFLMIEDKDIRLHLYGRGALNDKIRDYESNDSRIIFHGMVPNKNVVFDQLKATLLINPRPTTEEFTKYSFPSKNMEYMVSGTPMITTDLPGMPREYIDYVYIFNNESVDGMYKTLKEVLSKTTEELHSYGAKAKKFVLDKKNNKIQAKRLLEFFKS